MRTQQYSLATHPCANCPQIQDQIALRMKHYGNDLIAEYPEYADSIIITDVINFCGCDKLGSDIGWWDLCSDNIVVPSLSSHKSIRKHQHKYFRNKKYKKRLKHLYDSLHYPSSVEKVTGHYIRGGKFIPAKKAWYRRLYRGQRSKYLKRLSNRAVRRYKGNLQHGDYRRVFDFWWEYD